PSHTASRGRPAHAAVDGRSPATARPGPPVARPCGPRRGVCAAGGHGPYRPAGRPRDPRAGGKIPGSSEAAPADRGRPHPRTIAAGEWRLRPRCTRRVLDQGRELEPGTSIGNADTSGDGMEATVTGGCSAPPDRDRQMRDLLPVRAALQARPAVRTVRPAVTACVARRNARCPMAADRKSVV